MKTLKIIFFLAFIFTVSTSDAQNFRKQKKYLPSCVKSMKIYLGSSDKQLMKKCAGCQDQNVTEAFRKVYITDLEDKDFASIVFYVSTEKNEVYEMIFIAKDGKDINKMAKKLLGKQNTTIGEWRYDATTSGLGFNMACWTFKNKLVLAADLEGSEWESGFDQ